MTALTEQRARARERAQDLFPIPRTDAPSQGAANACDAITIFKTPLPFATAGRAVAARRGVMDYRFQRRIEPLVA